MRKNNSISSFLIPTLLPSRHLPAGRRGEELCGFFLRKRRNQHLACIPEPDQLVAQRQSFSFVRQQPDPEESRECDQSRAQRSKKAMSKPVAKRPRLPPFHFDGEVPEVFRSIVFEGSERSQACSLKTAYRRSASSSIRSWTGLIHCFATSR